MSASSAPVFREATQSGAPSSTLPISLRQGLAGGHNALNLIRLGLAAAVIISHAFPLGGYRDDPFYWLFKAQENLGGVAVIGFFAISGYLISRSGMNKDIVQYLWARALRIFPAFWLVLLVSAFVVGPLVWVAMGRSIGSYLSFGPGGPIAYLTQNAALTIRQYGILDVFGSNPYGASAGSVMNGSLWTLIYEWNCYLLIGVLVLFAALTRARVIVPMMTLLVLILQVTRFIAPDALATLVPWFSDPLQINLGLAFLWGACFAQFADRLPIHDGLGLLAFAVTACTLLFGGFGLVGFPAFAYFLMWLAVRAPSSLKRIGSRNDLSYGLYLYGWPVSQVLAFIGVHRLGYPVFVLASMIVALGLAWLSWHGLEKWALRLKDWGPGRGVRYWWSKARLLTRRPAPRRSVARSVEAEPPKAE